MSQDPGPELRLANDSGHLGRPRASGGWPPRWGERLRPISAPIWG